MLFIATTVALAITSVTLAISLRRTEGRRAEIQRQFDDLGSAAIRQACLWQDEKDELQAEIYDLNWQIDQYAEECNRLAEQDGEWFGCDECLSCGARMDASVGATVCDRCADRMATEAILG